MPELHWQWVDLLGQQLRRGGPFTALYAADVWGVDAQTALRRLQTLRWTGMIERLAEAQDALGTANELWRVTPVVYRTFAETHLRRVPKTLWETTLNPKTRRLLLVELPDALQADRVFDQLMGKDAGKRYEFIMDHAAEADDLDL